MRERSHLEDQGVGGRINVEMDLREVEWRGTGWIDLAQDTDRWRDVVNAVMNLRVP